MTLRQVKVPVKSFHGKCDTLCTECATTRAVISKSKSLNGTGVVFGQVVPRESDGASIWTEGCECFVNFEYDDTQLVVGEILKPCDLCLACGCIVDLIDNQGFYIEDEAGNQAFISPFEHILFTGTNLATVTVSDANPNVVDVNVPCSEVRTCFSALDTATVDYTYNPVTGIHFADVKISAAPGNDLLVNPDGLYVNFSDNCPEIRTCFSGLDTPSIDYTYNPLTGVHSANVKLSATAGNQITINPDGIYSPSDSLVNNVDNSFTHTAVDGSVDTIPFGHTLVAGGGSFLNLVQPNGTVLSVDLCPIVATCLTPQTPIVVIDTPSVNLTASGLDNHTLQADVIISPNAGNALSILGNGLFVGAGASDSLVDNGNRTFTHTAVNGVVTNFCQGISSIVTPNDCTGGIGAGVGTGYAITQASLNGCVLTIAGAPEHHTTASAVNGGGEQGVFNFVPVGTDYFSNSPASSTITNVSPCRPMQVLIYLEGGVTFNAGAAIQYNWSIQGQFNGGGYIDLKTKTSYSANTVSLGNNWSDDMGRVVIITIPPASSMTVDMRVRIRPINDNISIRSIQNGVGMFAGTD